jgi:hypothetical protein
VGSWLLLVAVLAGSGGCRKKPGENPRCRVFDQDPVNAEGGVLEDLRQAYGDAARIAECAAAARVSVEEFTRAHKVEERLRAARTILEGAAQNVLEGAQDRAWDAIQAVQDQVQ